MIMILIMMMMMPEVVTQPPYTPTKLKLPDIGPMRGLPIRIQPISLTLT